MLQPIIKELNSLRIVLASSSPRRKELLSNIGLNVELCASKFEENLNVDDYPSFSAFVEETALQKVLEVTARLDGIAENTNSHKCDIVIGADTMVTLNGKMYGKPTDKYDAINMLSLLSGNTNTVYTGVAIKYRDKIVKFTEKTDVHFATLTNEQIVAYVETGEPMDKAGSYGIQQIGSTLIKRINGDYFAVMGLPLFRLSEALNQIFHDMNKN